MLRVDSNYMLLFHSIFRNQFIENNDLKFIWNIHLILFQISTSCCNKLMCNLHSGSHGTLKIDRGSKKSEIFFLCLLWPQIIDKHIKIEQSHELKNLLASHRFFCSFYTACDRKLNDQETHVTWVMWQCNFLPAEWQCSPKHELCA